MFTRDSVVVLNQLNRALPNPMLKSRTLGRSMEEVGSSDRAGLLFPGVYFVTQPDFAKMHQHILVAQGDIKMDYCCENAGMGCERVPPEPW